MYNERCTRHTMQLKSSDGQPETRAFTRAEIKREMKLRKGFTFASYARMVRKSYSAITRVADGQIGGEFRERFLRFFGFEEYQIPRLKMGPLGRSWTVVPPQAEEGVGNPYQKTPDTFPSNGAEEPKS